MESKKFWYEKIPFLRESKKFFSSLEHREINLWPLLAPEVYTYYQNSEKIWWMRILSKLKYLFTLDKFKVPEGRKDKILATYFMPRADHQKLMFKALEDFPENEFLFLNYYNYKMDKSFLKFKFVFPDLFLLFKLKKKFRKFYQMGFDKEKVRHLFFRTYFRIKQIDNIKKIFDKTKPKAYISFCSQAFAEEAILTLLCRENGIPTFNMQHGFIVEYNNYFAPASILSENVISDFNFLWGKNTYDLLKNYVDKSKLLVVGNPKYDGMKKVSVKKFAPKKGLLFLPVIGNDSSSKKMLKIVNTFASNHPKIEFQMSLHPFDDIKNYDGIITSKNLKYIQCYDIFKLIQKFDFIILHNTTISIESLQYGKPIFRYDDKFLVKLWENDDCFKNIEDLENLFVKLLDPKIYQKWSKKYLEEFKNNFYLPRKGSVSENYYREIVKRIK